MSMIYKDIIRYNTRNDIEPVLSPWFQAKLRQLIDIGVYADSKDVLRKGLVTQLIEYKNKFDVDTVVFGMSGGIDSALSASLFKAAGWRVIGCTLPIEQNPEETDRGVEACTALDIEHIQIDLTDTYNAYLDNACKEVDSKLTAREFDDKPERVRAGNIRARLRMITLYNLANKFGGIVGSTDNFSELSAGFWTLHGDVGDVAPIQSLNKSWEVPMLAEHMGVPQSIVKATPTDGLGVDAGDEAQFGFSYLEFDIVLYALLNNIFAEEGSDNEDIIKFNAIKDKVRQTVYKRINPVNLDHPIKGSALYDALQNLDDNLIGE